MNALTPSVPFVPSAQTAPALDRRRYRRVLGFFATVTLDIMWWEIVLRRVLGRQATARNRAGRFRGYARRFRRLAVQLGGVMIKLGQFVSARVDVMPPAITEELADLQDEVPPEPLPAILGMIRDELGAGAEQVFADFQPDTVAAASLGQAHRARLPDGTCVIVKVQRPGIEKRVATDLAALERVARWTMYWPLIRRRADVPALLQEFAHTLWQELDYVSEAEHARRFRDLFSGDFRVYVPEVYDRYSTRRVITLEDVTSIKISDGKAIEAAGIDRAVAAQRLLDIYLKMIFDFGFFHADPHPGNLFIYPLPPDAAEKMYGRSPGHRGTPFYIVFVDFGMVGYISAEMKAGLREALIAVATRDARRVLTAYQQLGVLLPGADLARIEQAEREILDLIWGRSVPELAQMPPSQMREFALRYRDLLYEMPFQVPQDFIYLARAVGMLSGLCTALDPAFNPWALIADYGQKLVTSEATRSVSAIMQEALSLGQIALGLPRQMQDVLAQVQRGDLRARVTADQELSRDLVGLRGAVMGLGRAVVFASFLITATLLWTHGDVSVALAALGLATLTALSSLLPGRRT